MLEYLRFGFTSNSSSSHSIILLNDKVKRGYPKEDYGSRNDSFDSEFMLTSENGKIEYLQNQCFLNFERKLGKAAAKQLVKEMFNKSFSIKEIDHQSIITISEKTDENLKMEFLKQLTTYLSKNEKIAIWGAWDSGDTSIYDTYPGVPKNLFTSFLNNTTLRKDGDYQWTLFDRDYGYKLKLKLNDTISSLSRPYTPELLDVSITDQCFSNCSFCYRGSSKDGKFADLEKVKKIIAGASALGVFEIVFGGGEPTLHPFFPQILEYANKKGIAANFTTNDLTWTKNPTTLYEIAKNTSSLTVSIHSLKDFEEKKTLLEAAHKLLGTLRQQNPLTYDYSFGCFYRIIFQLVVDLIPDEELVKILKSASKSRSYISLVGFKSTGRAKDLFPKKKENLQTIISSDYDNSEAPEILSVDTCFLKEYPEFTQEFTCNIKEGWESFFIDATNDYFSLSSFSPEIKKVNLKASSLEIEDEMQDFFKNLEPK